MGAPNARQETPSAMAMHFLAAKVFLFANSRSEHQALGGLGSAHNPLSSVSLGAGYWVLYSNMGNFDCAFDGFRRRMKYFRDLVWELDTLISLPGFPWDWGFFSLCGRVVDN